MGLDELGEDLIIIGIIDPSVFIMGSLEEVPEALDALCTPRIRRCNSCLWPGTDGLAVPLERFGAVAAWMYGSGGLN